MVMDDCQALVATGLQQVPGTILPGRFCDGGRVINLKLRIRNYELGITIF